MKAATNDVLKPEAEIGLNISLDGKITVSYQKEDVNTSDGVTTPEGGVVEVDCSTNTNPTYNELGQGILNGGSVVDYTTKIVLTHISESENSGN